MLKYYIYVSDSKVDMLYSQIPTPFRKRIATQLEFDLKLISATLTPTTPPETRYSKLSLVDRYIRDNEHVGHIDEAGAYFAGELMMRWGMIRDGSLVYFGGATSATVLGMAGSRRHVIGAPGGATTPEVIPYSSAAFDLVEALGTVDPSMGTAPVDRPPVTAGSLEAGVAYTILSASEGMSGPRQGLEFLAKRLGEAEVDSRRVILGSPLYVAQVD